ncbi:MAG: hypothetical protein HC912_12060 [Saprospiraceae bacterium]|nr:hypothetical protein [Saprospiraceae bacterium]
MSIQEYIKNYQSARKKETIFLLVWGGISVIIGIIARYLPLLDAFWQAFLYPFVGLGFGMLIEAILNMVTYRRKKLFSNADPITSEKLRAIAQVKKLDLRRSFDSILFIVGFMLFILGGVITTQVFSAGMGMGLLLQSTVLFVKDNWALWRARLYVVELEETL